MGIVCQVYAKFEGFKVCGEQGNYAFYNFFAQEFYKGVPMLPGITNLRILDELAKHTFVPGQTYLLHLDSQVDGGGGLDKRGNPYPPKVSFKIIKFAQTQHQPGHQAAA